jgi:hypothetical protein
MPVYDAHYAIILILYQHLTDETGRYDTCAIGNLKSMAGYSNNSDILRPPIVTIMIVK